MRPSNLSHQSRPSYANTQSRPFNLAHLMRTPTSPINLAHSISPILCAHQSRPSISPTHLAHPHNHPSFIYLFFFILLPIFIFPFPFLKISRKLFFYFSEKISKKIPNSTYPKNHNQKIAHIFINAKTYHHRPHLYERQTSPIISYESIISQNIPQKNTKKTQINT